MIHFILVNVKLVPVHKRLTWAFFCRLLLLSSVLVLPPAAQAQTAAPSGQALPQGAGSPQESSVSVPFFWDPKAVQDRPKAMPDKIQFAASDDFPPFVFRDKEERLVGFNVDLARALCTHLGASCALKIVPFQDLVSTLAEGGADAVIAGLARSAKHSSTLAFTQDYLKLPGRFVVRAETAKTFDETALGGRTIAVASGSLHERFALRFWPEAVLLSFPTREAARRALQEGKADALFGSGLSLAIWLGSPASEACCRFSGGPWLEPGYFDQGLSIAVRKSDPKLVEALNYALRKVAEDGTFKELYLRYFPIGFY